VITDLPVRQELAGVRYLYAEGQRRYIESLSTYAKQFLERMPNRWSTQSRGSRRRWPSSRRTHDQQPLDRRTATEIYDFLRLLWARTGTQHCVKCGSVSRRQQCRK